MDTSKLKKFAQYARRSLQEQVSNRLNTVLEKESAARRENPKAVAELEEQIRLTDKTQVIEKVAYIWFNRFCALRFMDVNGYTPIRIVSPEAGQFQPAILAEAKMGHMDSKVVPDETQQQVMALLDGSATSQDPQGEAYRLLLVAACNSYHRSMSYLFERIADYTELLIPEDLLSGNSILSYVQQAMTPDACKDVEIIGWLYQFYISEKKDDVFESLKKNKKITPENIPAATQLFTPHYIVRYLVENSLGRLWMLNNPDSTLIKKMNYYIKPVEAETDFLKIEKPEELKICDPACGSGHMLSYAYDLLYAIYEEEGTDPSKIPEKILTHNLYGIELDERAGELASFALSMKAAGGNPFEEKSNHRRFFRKPVEPNICILENVDLQVSELKEYMEFAGRDLFTPELQTTLRQFDEADNFGSLIRPACGDVAEIREQLTAKSKDVPLLLGEIHKDVLLALKQADFLTPKYHVVVANPPYMGGKGMNPLLKKFASDNYKNSKSDLYAMFIERSLGLVQNHGMVGMITMQSWMFLSSYEAMRTSLLSHNTLMCMAHLGARSFDSIGGEVVSTTAFVFLKAHYSMYKGCFQRLIDGNCEAEKNSSMLAKEPIYTSSADDFDKVPGSPITYWVSGCVRNIFDIKENTVAKIANPNQALVTGNTERYIRRWTEVSQTRIGYGIQSREDSINSLKKWFPYNKGGDYRNWYGNCDHVVNWENDGQELQTTLHPSGKRIWAHNFVLESIFKEALVWSKISTGKPCFRYSPDGFLYDDASGVCSYSENKGLLLLGLFCSKVNILVQSLLNPTLNIQPANLRNIPLPPPDVNVSVNHVTSAIEIAKSDWDSYETSWSFERNPLIITSTNNSSLSEVYNEVRAAWDSKTSAMQKVEEQNNQEFIEAYGLESELSPNVEIQDVTLTCNPFYRYQSVKDDNERKRKLLEDTVLEFISYAVGCMFGRYSLDKPGLILANQGDTLENYLKQIPQPSFMPDQENVIPILEDSWFGDDIVDRFRQFLKVTFGEEHFEENLSFIEKAIGKDIRKFFVKDFYTDHLKRYKKRPIYWLFSSPKGTFNALIYMHRYRPDTASVVLNDYLREFSTKLGEEKKRQEQISISASASAGEKTKAIKQIDKLNKMLDEIDEYERDVLFPLATKQQKIELDDGVKHNYKLFGKALKKVAGLS